MPGGAGGLPDGSAVLDIETWGGGRLGNLALALHEVPGLGSKAPWLSGKGLVVPGGAGGESGAGVLEVTRCANIAIVHGVSPGPCGV